MKPNDLWVFKTFELQETEMMTVRGSEDCGWRGSHRFHFSKIDGGFAVKFTGLHTRSGRLRRDIGDFFRKTEKSVRPSYDPFQVRLWVVTTGWQKRIDLDNVAKACLDALTGYLWQDDSQVVRLLMEKVEGDAEMIVLEARCLEQMKTGDGLRDLLRTIERRV